MTALIRRFEDNAFIEGYMEAILFTECHSDNPELDGVSEFNNSALEQIMADCRKFYDENHHLWRGKYNNAQYSDDALAGHDFWLTRNHHGAGFWDRKELGDTCASLLTQAAQKYRELYAFLDTGAISLE